ncbi:Hypothetical predicted protein [Octopus vulgaris]|nr:Hypothetical predicted protein [Octopus vulgaris]
MATKKKYIAVGVQADFEILFNKFAKCKPLNFVEFAKVWRKMKMSMICMGRQTESEAKLLIEECLWITLGYFRAPYNFEVKTGAFFLLYGLYSTQFFVPKVRIRCTLNNWEELNCFIKEAMSKKMTDVEFIFHRLCVLKAFIYVASPNNVFQREYSYDSSEEMVKTLYNKQTPAIEELFNTENVQELSALHNQYQRVKGLLYEPSSIEFQSINLLEINPATNIMKILEKFHTEKESSTKKHKAEETILSRRKKLKYRSYGLVESDDVQPSTSSATSTRQPSTSGRISASFRILQSAAKARGTGSPTSDEDAG